MEAKNLLIASLVVNVGLIAVAGYLYVDGNSRNAFIEDLTKERDAAIEKSTSAENELKKLMGKLSLIDSNVAPEDTAQLKQTIDEKDAEITRLKAQLANAPARPPRNENGGPGGPGGNMRDMMENLRQQNPELYERMNAERERIQKEREERSANRERLIGGIDTAKLTDKQRETLEKYQELIKANEELRASGDRQNFFKMMQNQGMIDSYAAGEIRDILIEQYVDNIRKGSGSSAAEEIKTIISATSSSFGGGRPGGFGGGRPGGFGGGPQGGGPR